MEEKVKKFFPLFRRKDQPGFSAKIATTKADQQRTNRAPQSWECGSGNTNFISTEKLCIFGENALQSSQKNGDIPRHAYPGPSNTTRKSLKCILFDFSLFGQKIHTSSSYFNKHNERSRLRVALNGFWPFWDPNCV